MIKQTLGRLPRKTSKSSEWDSTALVSSSSSSSTNGDISSGRTANAYKEDNPGSNAGVNNGNAPVVGSKLNSSSIPASYVVLPKFKDVSSSKEQKMFMEKLNLCCVVFDFTDPTKNLKEKDVKRETLLELLDYVQSAPRTFLENVMQDIINMVSTNLFRTLSSPAPKEPTLQDLEGFYLDNFDLEEEKSTLEPSWSNLQVVYELFLRFVVSPETDAKLAKRYIDHSFVLKLLDLFDSEDPREREYLKTILHRIYGKFMVHRPFIRKAINNIFYRFIFETEKHNGIAELLEILGGVINGFALPLREEHKLFLVRSLIQLHKPKCMVMYHQQLSYCITRFIEKDCQLADTVIRGLLKFWPITNSSKELMFLGELEEILEATQPLAFRRCMVPLFRQIARCIDSPHFQVKHLSTFSLMQFN